MDATKIELFSDSLIDSYVGNQRYIARTWLEDLIRQCLVETGHSFLLVTGRPGTGKSAVMAALARQQPKWPRYFIRRNEVSPLGSVGARSLLFQTGLQLATHFPAAFSTRQLNISIEQRLQRGGESAEVIGAEIRRLVSSPFVTATIRITQEVENAHTVAGLKIGELIAEPRMMPVADLQYLALMDPASAIAASDPAEKIVVLIDALDELRYQSQDDSLLNWLENCPVLPGNVRIVIASRPDDALLATFRRRQDERIREFSIDSESHAAQIHVRGDLKTYAARLVNQPEVSSQLEELSIAPDTFAEEAIGRADGNIGYLDALGRGIDQVVALKDRSSLAALLRLKDVPPGLRDLYSYFLHMVRRRAMDRTVSVVDTRDGTVGRAIAWSEVHSPMLSILSVAVDPLSPAQIRRLAMLQASDDELYIALQELGQFLTPVNGAYRLYHAAMIDFLSDPATRDDPGNGDLFQDPLASHIRIAVSYERAAGGWEQQPDWKALDDYGWRHLSHHLVAGGKPLAARLYQLYTAGFLAAKRKVVGSVSLLQQDWRLILEACAQANDILPFLRFGYQISQQAMELSLLALGGPARVAVDLALRKKDPRALQQVAVELASVEYLPSRISGQLMLVTKLLDGSSDRALVTPWLADIRGRLPLLSPGSERDKVFAAFVALVSRVDDTHLQDDAAEGLRTITTLHCRTRIYAALASASARSGDARAAVEFFTAGIDELRGFEMEEDIVSDILQMVLHVERVEPSAELAMSIDTLSIAFEAFGSAIEDSTLRALIGAVREQLARIRNETARLDLEVKIFHYLRANGHRDLAVALARPMLDEQIRKAAPPSTDDLGAVYAGEPSASTICADLLTVLAMAAEVDETTLFPAVQQAIFAHTNRASRVESMMHIAQFAGAVSQTGAHIQQALAVILGGIEECAREVLGGEGLFVVLAILIPGWVRAGDPNRAISNIQEMLRRVPAVWPAPQYPEEVQARSTGFQAFWTGACMAADDTLLRAVAEWMTSAVYTALDFSSAGAVWSSAAAALELVPDIGRAQSMMDYLVPRVLESRAVERYEATAALQFANAYSDLGMKDECFRFLNSVPGQAAAQWHNLAGWACSLRAKNGDAEGAAKVLGHALDGVPNEQGDNVKGSMLITLSQGLRTLAASGPNGAAQARKLGERFIAISQKIDGGQYSLHSLAAISQALLEGELPAPLQPLAEMANRHLDRGTAFSMVDDVLYPLSVLFQASKRSSKPAGWRALVQRVIQPYVPTLAAQRLLARIEQVLESGKPTNDPEGAQFCSVCSHYFHTLATIGEPEHLPSLRARAGDVAEGVVKEANRVSACCSVARIYTIANQGGDARQWLDKALAAYGGVKEIYERNRAAEEILGAWQSLPDPALRSGSAGEMERVLWRLDDPKLRTQFQAHIGVGTWDVTADFFKMIEQLPSASGSIDFIVQQVSDHEELPAGILPAVIFRCLEKTSRHTRLGFASQSLTAAQAAVRHGAYDRSTLAGVLEAVEQMMREISPTGFAGPAPLSRQT